MKTLKEIFNDVYIHNLTPTMINGVLHGYSDKNTNHRYVDCLYEDLFKDIRLSAKNVLEIGIFGGGSLLLWQEYFKNANIYGVDNSYFLKELIGQERITQIIGDAYTDQVVGILADNMFDVVLDDGPHTLESFKLFIQKYWSKVKPGGYLIIEDIFDIGVTPELIGLFPAEYQDKVSVYDFRTVTNLFDEVLLVIKK